MAFIGFIKTSVFLLIAVFISLSVVGHLIPWVRNKGWKSKLVFFLFSLFFAYQQGVRVVRDFTEEKLAHIQHDNPPNSTDIAYFVGDFLSTLKMLGGPITPEMWKEVQHIATDGTPGHAAMAQKLLSEAGQRTTGGS